MTEQTVTTGGMLKVKEVAKHLSLSVSKTYQLIASGELQSVAIGRSRRVPRAALEKFEQALLQQAGG